MNQAHSNYHAYLIRFWRMDNAGQPVWRVGVEVPSAPSLLYFDNLAALFAFLAAQLGVSVELAQSPPCSQGAAGATPLGGSGVE